jgi:hypothetical protein
MTVLIFKFIGDRTDILPICKHNIIRGLYSLQILIGNISSISVKRENLKSHYLKSISGTDDQVPQIMFKQKYNVYMTRKHSKYFKLRKHFCV